MGRYNTELGDNITKIDKFVVKKNGTRENFDINKVVKATSKSANRVMHKFTPDEVDFLCTYVTQKVLKLDGNDITIDQMHNIAEKALSLIDDEVADSYRSFRNYKQDFVAMLDDVYKEVQRIMYIGDKENSNTDSALVSTKRSLIYNQLNKELYKKFFLTTEELQACKDGYIYIHDMSARRDTMNCCIADIKSVMTGGFEMGNLDYCEPKTLDVAFDVIGDIVLSAASQQYGGFTVPEIDKLLRPYAEKEFERLTKKYRDLGVTRKTPEEQALIDITRILEQGFQGFEMKFNSVASSRGDYPFIAMTSGLDTSEMGRLTNKVMFRVRANGQGKPGHKRVVLFPKLIMLYDENIHDEGKIANDVFEAAIDCSSKAMYPDWLSLTGEGYVADMYKRYGKVVSPMGCRAFLSPWYERGGMYPADKDDKPVFVGRFNIGVVSLNLPMILAKSRQESRDFYEVLDYYLEMIRNIHLRTYEYLGEMKASVNPLMYCEGGFYGGHLKPDEKIKSILKPMTASFGITALNELQQLYNKKSIREDGQFALEVMQYINKKIDKFKKKDGVLYAIYGTPAENLCGLQVKQFRQKYGIIPNVSDREYVSNSFHCHVSEEMSPIEKQDKEARFWNLFNGGKIQYVKYPVAYNKDAIRTLVKRAMKKGLYEGVNLSLAYCNQCGHEELNMNICPHCGSDDITKIERMNGYLSYSRVHGDTRLNSAKMAEIKDRVSM